MLEYALSLIEMCRESGDSQLDLGGLALSDLPPEIGDLTQLTHLSVRGNALQTLPSEIGGLTDLQQLSIADNQLQQLPPEIGSLKRLRRLNARRNQLDALPEELLTLTELELLQLTDNPLPIPADVLARWDRPSEILDYYQTYCLVTPEPPSLPLADRIAAWFSEGGVVQLIDNLAVPAEAIDDDSHLSRSRSLVAYHETHGLREELEALIEVYRESGMWF